MSGEPSRRGSGRRGRGSGGRGDQGGRGGGPPPAGRPTEMPYRQDAPRGGGGGRGGRGGDRGGGRGGRGGRGEGAIYLGSPPIPDPEVTRTENALVKNTQGQLFGGFTGRKSFATLGTPITLRANYFRVNTPFDIDPKGLAAKTLFKYDVAIAPEPSKEKRRRMFIEILQRQRFNNKLWATDYANFIVTTEKIDLGSTKEWEEKITLPPVDGTTQNNEEGPVPEFVKKARARNTYKFKVEYKTSFSLQDIIDYLRSTSAGAVYEGHEVLIQVLNVVVAKPPQRHDLVVNVGKNTFFPFGNHPGKESCDLGRGLEALRGYFSSIRPTVGRLLLNMNVSSGAFYKEKPLLELVQEHGNQDMDQLENFISKLKVTVTYKKDKDSNPPETKTRTIIGFAKEMNPRTFRAKRNGNAEEIRFPYVDRSLPNATEQQITVFDYFRREKGITLRRPKAPVINVGTRADPQYLPMEICSVKAGQPYRRLLSGNQTSEMITFAARYPNLNAMSIAGTTNSPGNALRLFRLADGSSDLQAQTVKPWGFSVSTEMISVPGRILNSPKVEYGGNKSANPQRGSWNLASVKFAIPGRFTTWQVLVINLPGQNALIQNPQGDMLGPDQLFPEFQRSLGGYGIQMGQRVATQTITLDPLSRQNRDSNDKKLKEAFNKANGLQVRMIFIVLPDVDRWLYARIKYFGDVEFGIHTINAVGRKFQKPGGQPMYFGNLALKFNIKGGGVCHKVPNTLTRPLDNNTMLVGIDVTHPSPGSTAGAPSIACVVASTDEHLFQWPGSIRTQTGREEMVQGMEEMVLERLDLWRKKHQTKLPDKVVIYRDGVSESQYQKVMDEELPFFQAAYKKRYGDVKKWPKTAIIIVGKRHHTRFYPTREEDADFNPQTGKGSWNPKPGTVVDRGIVGPIIHEFYLQAHQGLQGTARPAHYVVLKDDIGFSADELERITHNMCYLFNRATKAVSICPPAYYADLLCERGRAYLYSSLAENHGSESSVFNAQQEWSRDVHPRLQESTWYI